MAACQGEVVGLLSLSATVKLEVLQGSFSLDALIAREHHAPSGHGEIDIYCMNPIFAHRWEAGRALMGLGAGAGGLPAG